MVRVPSAKVVGRHPTSPFVHCTSVISAVLHHRGPLIAGHNVSFFLPLAFLFDTSITFDTTQPGKIFVPRTRRQKKSSKIRKQKTDLYIHSPLSPITTTFASYSRSFAILLACCERRRLRFNTLHPFPTIPLRLSGRDEYFLRPMLLFFPGRATDDVQNTRAVTLLLDVACS